MAALKRTSESLSGQDLTTKDNAEMETAFKNGDLTTAWRKLEAAQIEVDASMKNKTGGSMGASAAAAAAAIAGFDPLAAFNLPQSWVELARQSAAHTARTITMWDVLISVIVLVAAGAIGIQTLWVDNATWGGGPMYLTAFLWGFAADQFTHAGVAALWKK
jgi:hypothetical protein